MALISLGIAGSALEKPVHAQSGGKKTLWFAAATGLIIAVYTTIDGIGLRMAESPLAFIVWFFVLDGAFVTLAVIAARSGRVEPFLRRSWRHGVIAGILGVVTYGLALFALGLGAIVEIAALRETSVVFAALIGMLVLREPYGRRRVATSAIVAAGVILMHVTR